MKYFLIVFFLISSNTNNSFCNINHKIQESNIIIGEWSMCKSISTENVHSKKDRKFHLNQTVSTANVCTFISFKENEGDVELPT